MFLSASSKRLQAPVLKIVDNWEADIGGINKEFLHAKAEEVNAGFRFIDQNPIK